MPRKAGRRRKPTLSDAEDAEPARRRRFLRALLRQRHQLSPDELSPLVGKLPELMGDADPRVRRLSVTAVRCVQPLMSGVEAGDVWTALEASLSDESEDVRREVRKAVRRLQFVIPEDARRRFINRLLTCVIEGPEAAECAILIGQFGGVIPSDLLPMAVDTLMGAMRGDDPVTLEAIIGLAFLARYASSQTSRVRSALLKAIVDDAIGGEAGSWERAFAPLRDAPEFVRGEFMSRVLDLAQAGDARTRLRAAAVLRATRPAVRGPDLWACVERVLELNVDQDEDVRDEAEDALSEFLLSLPLLSEEQQTEFVRQVATLYPRFDPKQRIGMLTDAHTLHEMLSDVHKEPLLERLLADSHASDPEAAGYALHTAAALVVGSRHDLVDRVVQRTVELGRTGAKRVKGQATDSWGDLLDAVPEQGRMTAVEELARLASEGVRSLFGDPWSILELNRSLLPADAISVLVPRFLSTASDPEASRRTLRDAAQTLSHLFRRVPGDAALETAPEEEVEAAYEAVVHKAERGVKERRSHAIEALGVLALLLPAERAPSVVEELGRLSDEVSQLRDRSSREEDDELDSILAAIARTLTDLVLVLPNPVRASATRLLDQMGTGRWPVPEALAGLVVHGSRETMDGALDALLGLATGRHNEDLRCRAIQALGDLSAFPNGRSTEVAGVLIDLLDEAAAYVPGCARDALVAIYSQVPDLQTKIVYRLAEAVRVDGDSYASYALADLGDRVPDEMKTRVVETLRQAYESSAGEEDDWRFARGLRDFAMDLPPEGREWLWSVRTG